MSKSLLGLSALALLASPALRGQEDVRSSARIALPAAQPVPIRVAASDAVVVGKVIAVEEKSATAARYPGTPKIEYRVAVVQIDDGLVGTKGMTHIRVGFVPAPMVNPGDGPRIRPGLPRPVQLDKGDEVCLFLTRHFEGDFYHFPGFYDAVKKDAGNFAQTVEEARKAAKLLSDTKANLTGKDQAARYETAAMLIARYRTQKVGVVKPGAQPKTEAIDAEESKLILTALAEANWAAPNVNPGPGGFMMAPLQMFNRLGLTAQDGWVPPQGGNFVEAAQKWVKDNAATYRIKKFVAE
jgi:hypothetical protein